MTWTASSLSASCFALIVVAFVLLCPCASNHALPCRRLLCKVDHARRVLKASDHDNDPAAALAPYVSDDCGNESLFDRLRSLMDPTTVQQRDLALSRLRMTALTDADWQPSEEEQKCQQVNEQLAALASEPASKFAHVFARVFASVLTR